MPPTGADPGAADLAACRAILAAGSKSFAAASRLLPARVRDPVAAMYAFCRVADDAVDGAPEGHAGQAVAALRGRLDRLYAHRPDPDPVDRAFAAVVREAGIPRGVPDALLEGFLWDAEGRAYETLPDLLGYAARVASTVGVMMTLLLDPAAPDRTTLARACDLGLAMQLTNIARDVGEDARMGRVYLPLAWLREEGVDPARLLAEPRFDPGVGRVVERLLAAADALYERADRGIPRLPADGRAAIRAARLVYADIGRVVRRRGCDSVTGRARTSAARKAWLLGRALLRPTPPGEGDGGAPAPEVAFLLSGF